MKSKLRSGFTKSYDPPQWLGACNSRHQNHHLAAAAVSLAHHALVAPLVVVVVLSFALLAVEGLRLAVFSEHRPNNAVSAQAS